ncbi:MAG TPA: hypothetical protein VNO51_07790 [Ilumatobacteraceae bacterium]|nr:hypothetical protein [Ilumatobacteraceae bacterium]
MTQLTRWARPVVIGVFAALAIIAVFHMQLSAANYDPQYMRVLVERTIRLGGSYYENGVHNKGPLEPAVYELAGRIGGRSGFWFVIAIFTMATTLVIAAATAIVTELAGGVRAVAISVAAMATAHLTLSDSDYAGVLYSRNITVGLLAATLAVGAWDGAWRTERRRIGSVLVAGLAIGLAVQTLLSACFTAVPVLAWVMWTRRHERVRSRPAWLAVPLVAAVGFLSAPIYYRIFGPWDAFVDGWWTYARWMNSATGRSLGGQFGLGVDQFGDYYGDRPVLFVVTVAFLAEMVVRWRALGGSDRALRATIAGWWLAAWIELALSQRYSSHYFSILAVPSLLMIAVLVGATTRRLVAMSKPASAVVSTALPLAVTIITIYVGGTAPFREGFREASAFEGVDDFDERREQLIDGRTHMLRAALDLVSEPDDPLLMWTSYPWPYLNLHRVPATRYIWKTFLLGEIYLARSGPQYVLPGTWETFAADVERTDPTAFVVEAVNPVVTGTPFETLVDENFSTVFTDDVATLAFRDDLARWLRSPPLRTTSPASTPTVELDPDVPEALEASGCVRLDGDIVSALNEARVSFRFGAASSTGEVVPAITYARTGGNSAAVTSRGTAGNPFATQVVVSSTDATAFTLVVGSRAAVLVVDGMVVGAVEMDGHDVVMVEASSEGTRLEHLVRSAPPAESGC